MVYADNAATTKLDVEAYENMKKYLLEDYGNPSQPYSFSRVTKSALSKARSIIAGCVGADPEEIFFTSGGTESDNWALKGYLKGSTKGRLIVSSIEHHAILNTAKSLSNEGIEVNVLSVTKDGVVLPSILENAMTNNTSLVSVMLGNNEVGSIQPITELSEIAHKYGAKFHTDAVQAVGHIDINVKKLGVDMLSASAHKFNGPRGTGFLYVKNGMKLSPLMDGGAQEKHMRAGTENVAAIVGMATALKNNCDSISTERLHLSKLEDELLTGLLQRNIHFIRNGTKNHLPGNISLSFKDSDGEMLLHRLDLMGICVSTGSACDSKNTQISHVIKAIGVPEEYAAGTIRISLGKDNTSEDIEIIVNALEKILV